MAKSLSKAKILFYYQRWLLPVAIPLLLLSSAAEFLFLKSFIDMVAVQEAAKQDAVLASSARQAVFFLALKITLQILSTGYIVFCVRNL